MALQIKPERTTLRYLLRQATQGTPHDDVIAAIFSLCDQIHLMSKTPAAEKWFQKQIALANGGPPEHAVWRSRSLPLATAPTTDATASVRSHPAGGGRSKRSTVPGGSDRGPTTAQGKTERKRQVTPRIYYAPSDSDVAPSFPPRIARRREPRQDSIFCRT